MKLRHEQRDAAGRGGELLRIMTPGNPLFLPEVPFPRHNPARAYTTSNLNAGESKVPTTAALEYAS